jgi:hypothetical protein
MADFEGANNNADGLTKQVYSSGIAKLVPGTEEVKKKRFKKIKKVCKCEEGEK